MADIKGTIRRFANEIGQWPWVSPLIQRPSIRERLQKVPGANLLYGNGWDRRHPFDRLDGTDTSGQMSPDALPAHEAARKHANAYGGSQPNVLRRALATLPAVNACTFVDLGCGKGRPLLVASEFSFRDIVGVELSPALARVGRRNAAIVARRHPQRTPIRIVEGDASAFPMPAGNVVLFMYHPFGAELVARVVAGVEAALASERRSIQVVYYNPVAGHCFDASPVLRRRFAQLLPYAAEELGYGPDVDDAVIIWEGGGFSSLPAPEAGARIVVGKEGHRASLSTC
jgi:SAM-dependent methyltransferase